MFIKEGSAVAQMCVNGRRFPIASRFFGRVWRPPNALQVRLLNAPVRCLRVCGPDPGGMTCITVMSVLVRSASSARVSGTFDIKLTNWRSAKRRLICVLRWFVFSGSAVLNMHCFWPSELRGNTPRISMSMLSPRISVAIRLRRPNMGSGKLSICPSVIVALVNNGIDAGVQPLRNDCQYNMVFTRG